MSTMDTRTLWWDSSDGLRLHAYDHGDPDASKTLVIVHGYGEHGGRYHHHAQRFVDAGYRVIVPDVRGHGHSEGARGHTPSFSLYLEDLDLLSEHVKTPRERTALLGHSNGGLIVVSRTLVEPTFFATSAVTSPLLGVAIEAPKWKLIGARLLSKIAPKISLPTEIDPALLSHDPEVVAAYEQDPLGHKVNNARWYTEAMDAIESAFQNAGRVQIPMLVMQAGDDQIVSPEATRQWVGAAPSSFVQYEEVPGAYHELLFEVEGDTHCARLLEFFEAQLDGAASDA